MSWYCNNCKSFVSAYKKGWVDCRAEFYYTENARFLYSTRLGSIREDEEPEAYCNSCDNEVKWIENKKVGIKYNE